ncbi:MAG: NAD(P)/FAD-dependent oxidoreductase [Thermoplasmatales archaeon]
MGMLDFLVVGAGPSGSYVSSLLARKGYSVRIVDLKQDIGIPNHCSGLVDRRVVDIVGDDLVISKPSFAEIHTPTGSFTLTSGKMYVLDRVELDKKLAGIAETNGVKIDKRTLLVGLSQNGYSVRSLLSRGGRIEIVESKYVIGADGPSSATRRYLGIPRPKLLRSVQYDVKKRTDRVNIFMDRRRVPDFFAWEVPHDGETEIGASGTGSGEMVASIAAGQQIVRKRGGLIPIGGIIPGSGNCYLVGDAAGMNKATTGGGLYGALISGKILAETVSGGGNVKKYGKLLLDGFGREVKRALTIRNIFDYTERHYRLWVPLVKSNIRGINRVGDVDYPSKAFLYVFASIPLRLPLILTDLIRTY